MCAAGAGRPLPRFVQKAEGRGPGECGPFQDFTRTCSEKPCSPASARSSAKSLLPAARRRGGIAAPLPADRKNGMPCPCLCLPPSRRLRPPAASLLLRAALRKRRRLPNLSFQRRTNDARPNSLSRAQRNALRLLPFGDFSSQSGAVLRPGASLPEKRCPSCLPCPEKSLSTAAEAVFAADRLPVSIPAKSPAQRRETAFAACFRIPRSFRSHERSGHRRPPQLPCLHSVRMPARLLHSCAVFSSRLGFCIPAQCSASRSSFSPPAQCPHSATPLKRRSSPLPHSTPPIRRPSAPEPLRPGSRHAFVRFLKRKSPLKRGPFS